MEESQKTSETPLLNVSELRSGYGPIEVLKGISLHVNAGEIVTVIGANGAGKTTTLMTVSGCVKIRGGDITFDGRSLTGIPAHEIVKLGMAQSPEGRKIFPRLTVLENLQMGAFTVRDQVRVREDIEKAYHYFPILKDRQKQLGGTLSGGEQQMLAIARALMIRPKLLLLDEPSLGLAPMIVLKIFEVIRELNREGMSVLLVEQNARLALKIANRGYVMETGSITATAPAQELLNDPRIQAAYLGE
ncbi:ABC transporter ATP-binding protein [Zavarzinella formosa]|uniref:ABC transporter ATP-binding protein n=1 Tax=Zavarzinella formosa TaxID=360055 RepID=UPI001930C444